MFIEIAFLQFTDATDGGLVLEERKAVLVCKDTIFNCNASTHATVVHPLSFDRRRPFAWIYLDGVQKFSVLGLKTHYFWFHN